MDNRTRRLLIVTEGPNQGQSYVLQDLICTLGRTADNTIVIDSPRISRHHTQIRLLPDGAIVEDMGSTNGTWVNNRQLTGPHRLAPGDVIELADSIAFRFEVEEEMRTEKLVPTMADADPGHERLSGPPPLPPDSPPYRPYQDSAETPAPFAAAQPAQPIQPPPLQPAVTPRRQRPKWSYLIVIFLIILICLCVAVAAFLWFAPTEFWLKVYELFNIPAP